MPDDAAPPQGKQPVERVPQPQPRITAAVVVDPGHGGTVRIGGSSANNTTSPSGVLEKAMCLEMGRRVRDSLRAQAPGRGVAIDVQLTRASNRNVGLAERANLARDRRAGIFLSIHFNAFDGVVRGVETHVRPASAGNVNLSADSAFAGRVQDRVLAALRRHDRATRNRGVKQTRLAVLNDASLGNSPGNARTRSCLLEIEFIDVLAVDRLLNSQSNSAQVKQDVADAIAQGILDDIIANS